MQALFFSEPGYEASHKVLCMFITSITIVFIQLDTADIIVFEGFPFGFLCRVFFQFENTESLQLRLDGQNNTINDRLFITFQSQFTVHYEIQPVTIEDDGTLIRCMIQTPTGTLVSENSILLSVYERLGILT